MCVGGVIILKYHMWKKSQTKMDAPSQIHFHTYWNEEAAAAWKREKSMQEQTEDSRIVVNEIKHGTAPTV